jgi:hypothetical protein
LKSDFDCTVCAGLDFLELQQNRSNMSGAKQLMAGKKKSQQPLITWFAKPNTDKKFAV